MMCTFSPEYHHQYKVWIMKCERFLLNFEYSIPYPWIQTHKSYVRR